jgi:membrane-associated phospholipid phosphatase
MFIIGSLLNNSLNELLKVTIKQPRPKNQISYIDDTQIKGAHIYGMPSGHAQISFFAITYLYLTKRTLTLVLISLFIGCLTLYQRWNFRRHSIEQLIAGSITGSALSYFIFWITSNYLEGVYIPKSLF